MAKYSLPITQKIWQRVSGALSGVANIEVEIRPGVIPSWESKTRTIRMPPSYLSHKDEELDFRMNRGVVLHEGSHILFCPDVESLPEELTEDKDFMQWLNVFLDVNNEYKLTQIFPHLKEELVCHRPIQTAMKPKVLTTDNPWMQVLMRTYALWKYEAKYPPEMDSEIIKFCDEVVSDFNKKGILDCTGDKLVEFTINVYSRWKSLKKSVETPSAPSEVTDLMKELGSLIKGGASKEEIDAKKAEIAKVAKPKGGLPKDGVDDKLMIGDIKKDSKGVASEETIDALKKILDEKARIASKAMIREPAENIVNKKLGKKLIVIEPPDCKNPEEYDKNQAYKVAMKLKKHLRQRIFQQLDFEQKHKSGSVDIDAIRSQVAKCGRITNNAVFQRKNFYTRGGEWVVEVLIDLSGSMKGKMGDAKQALATLGYAFDGLPNVHYALTGFTTTPEQGVVEVHIKNHTDRRMNIKRVDKLDAMRGNADGVNIRSACIRLLRRKNMKRLLVVISDGEPAGPFFEARGSSVEDVRQAVKFAEHYGVKVVGIGIPEIEPVAMKKMYKNWICFDKTDGIYKSIGKLIVEALE